MEQITMDQRLCLYIEFVGDETPPEDGIVKSVAPARRLVDGGTTREQGDLSRQVEQLDPGTVILDTSLKRTSGGDSGPFSEWGELIFGDLGTVTIESVQDGIDTPTAAPDEVGGGVVFRVTGGTGAFADAKGHVTSNFVITADGTLHDAQVAIIETP